MSTSDAEVDAAYGFFTVFDQPGVGLLGGYLVVDRRGRPLEFHCTAPVLASRAEEILFGPTLRPHLFCQRIGAALLAKATTQAAVVVVNQLESWPLAEETSLPVALVDPAATGSPSTAPPPPAPAALACLDQVAPARRGEVERQLEALARYVDLSEPFDRITEAIREAGQLADPSAATDEPLDARAA